MHNPIAKLAVILSAAAILLYGYAQGPDAGLAGVPGELGTCTGCHSGGSGTGNVKISFPNGNNYTPGVQQHLTLTVTDSAQRRWGFEMTARQSTNTQSMAGSFTPGADGYTQLICSQAAFKTESSSCSQALPLQYIEHTLRGTQNGTKGAASFQFDWTPPSTNAGNITFYVAANAANGDGNTGGDHIYTAQATLTPAVAGNQPTITGVVNGAGFQNGITAGSWVTIQGGNLAGTSRTWTNSEIVNGQLPTQLDNVSVTIDGHPAAVYYISPTQVNVEAPGDSNQGPVNVQVSFNGAVSNSFTAQLISQNPAFFLWSGKYAVATRQDYSLVGPASLFPGSSTPAKPGDVVILWGTGFGATTPTAPSLQLVPSTSLYSVVNPPSITVGGLPATVYGAALAPGFAGLYQISIQIPPAVGSGDQIVVAQPGGVASPNGVFVAVQ
ncbi:MAG: choice-of-anchor V domain-containing protein [Bryobacteraceae bacterium]